MKRYINIITHDGHLQEQWGITEWEFYMRIIACSSLIHTSCIILCNEVLKYNMWPAFICPDLRWCGDLDTVCNTGAAGRAAALKLLKAFRVQSYSLGNCLSVCFSPASEEIGGLVTLTRLKHFWRWKNKPRNDFCIVSQRNWLDCCFLGKVPKSQSVVTSSHIYYM